MAFKIRILSPGKTKHTYLQEGISDYLKRLSHYVSIEMISVPIKFQKQKLFRNLVLKKEAELLKKQMKPNAYLIVLEANGRLLSSEELAEFLQTKKNSGISTIDFLIGGEWGISEDIKRQADLVLSLSRMTFTHDMTRLVLLEQIYRAFTILKGESYHK